MMQFMTLKPGQALNALAWFFMACTLSACATTSKNTSEASADCLLCGQWQSHEAHTLRDLYAYGEVSAEQLSVFTQGYFGRLTIEFKPDTLRWTLTDKGAKPTEWHAYDVLDATNETIRISSFDPERNAKVEQSFRFEYLNEGEVPCFSMPLGDMNFREIFCQL